MKPLEMILLGSVVLFCLALVAPFAKERYQTVVYDPTANLMSTCRDIQLNGDILTAICKKKDGTEQTTGINVKSCPIGTTLPQNEDGTIVCASIGVSQTDIENIAPPSFTVSPQATWQTRTYSDPFKILDPATNTVVSFDASGVSKDSRGLPYTDSSFSSYLFCEPQMNC